MTGYRTKAEIVYNILLEKITNGEYKPGEKLVIRRLTKDLGVSEIPIREAIKNLEAEGYVSHDANKSVTICKMGIDDLDDFFHIRGVLEGYATRESIDHLTEKDISELKEINNEMRQACMDGDTSRFSELNQTFHLRIYKNNPNQVLVNLIKDLWRKWSITKRVFSTNTLRMSHSIDDHDKIISLIEKKEYEAVEFFVREHKFNAGKEMIEAISKS